MALTAPAGRGEGGAPACEPYLLRPTQTHRTPSTRLQISVRNRLHGPDRTLFGVGVRSRPEPTVVSTMSVCRCFKLIVWVPNLKEGGWCRCAQSARHKVASLRGRPPSPQSLDAPASRASPAVVADSPAYRGQGASQLGLRTASEKVHWRPGNCSAAEPQPEQWSGSGNSSVMSILLSPRSAPCRYAVVSKSGRRRTHVRASVV